MLSEYTNSHLECIRTSKAIYPPELSTTGLQGYSAKHKLTARVHCVLLKILHNSIEEYHLAHFKFFVTCSLY